MSEYLLEMKGIVKQFDGVRALDGIDLKIKAGECVGLCGENGAGKSTLMKILSGVYPHGTWDGDILWDGKPLVAHSVRDTEAAGIVIIHQELMLVPELSVAENIFMGHELTLPGGRMNYPAMYRRAEELMRELNMPDINVALPVMQYGGGHQQLVEIAKALNKKARLLILDEPSSSLTTSEIAVLLKIIKDLKAKGVACVYISHKLDEVAAVCDTISVIRDGKHIATTPMEELDVDRIITQMVGREITAMYPRRDHEVGEIVFEARHMTCLDVDNPKRKRVDDVSFSVRRGEILGIAGLVGAGRTELVSAIFGAYPGRCEGEVWMNGARVDTGTPLKSIRLGLCMVPEDRKQHGIVPDLNVGQNITLTVLKNFSRGTRIDAEAELKTVTEEIARMRLKTSSPFLPITGLSGGNQQKAVLAKMLLAHPKVLILDEPTRGVDVGAKAEIYRLIAELAKQGVAVIMVSSELAEVLGVSDRVLVIGEGKLRGDFVNQDLTQEMVLAAAINQSPPQRMHVATPSAA
ncbi:MULTISPECIES: D-xylose ABC transporter ATP-binding protein [unclassified Herbaspirillum]|uniref:D-xylose ABC transporter ATP-binding protein n=1 Tax=unclassified Herbaspirillum TaxID=2624150 RepID=UPI000E2F8302|nr:MULTISPECIES: D-xylose ABC transporter ATP-binding protein [unclassified Herbaspirillum]RFB69510.1 D-xylose ABC transporter ATP-binding protein [Herbaspirillum sp. 3R-3a1]TFI07436.1 D-xylose ABC transporter ATP-binding protein [Herbaspirillum sp. 3R11]TFI12209.1 D-xylose ABC transporter ATP-binding protein [Herbaspirillum sp. 3R-11]TFI19801.1 D-xylose ABC transporter ATP-binding protein [Herbaspirillum sp. 3C11]